MRKTLLLLVIFLGGLGSAQTTVQGLWAGGSVGAPGLTFHLGAEDALGVGVDLRGNLGFSYLYSSGFYLGGNALFDLGVDTTVPFDLYAGVGPFITVGGGFGLGAEGFIGGEYRFVEAGFPEGGVFFEVGPDLYLAPRAFFGVTARLGFNYHF
jgi:hypothetical protein